jgi:hypothetical protein
MEKPVHKIDMSDLLILASETARIHTHFSEKPEFKISEATRAKNKTVMEEHAAHFKDLCLPMCEMQCLDIATAMDKEITGKQYGEMLVVLRGRMAHEVKLAYGFLLTPSETALYREGHALFGEAVSAKFPAAVSDIDEAGKCLALGRGTAAVMHLMRVMEVGLKALARPLGIPYAPSWESYLRQINDKMAIPYAEKPKTWRKKEPFFRDLSGDLITVKHSWRNPTMHVVRQYDPEEATDVLRAVKRFMQRLADGLTR